MSNFSGAAPRKADRQLFGRTPRGAKSLNAQSRKELRQKAREDYWAKVQASDAAADGTNLMKPVDSDGQ